MIKKAIAVLLAAAFIANLCGCGQESASANGGLPDISGYGEPEKTENTYAECFDIYGYGNGDTLITMDDGSAYLVTDSAPVELDGNITVVPRSTDMIYMAASAVMCFYDALGRIGDIRFSWRRPPG